MTTAKIDVPSTTERLNQIGRGQSLIREIKARQVFGHERTTTLHREGRLRCSHGEAPRSNGERPMRASDDVAPKLVEKAERARH